MGIKKVFQDYKSYRTTLGSYGTRLYIKKILIPILITAFIYFGMHSIFGVLFDHKAIASVLVSVNSIVVAFLVFSMTILITKDNENRIPNTTIKYVDVLMNNTEVNSIFSLVSISSNLFYLYMANPVTKIEGLTYYYSLLTVGAFSLFLTIFIIKFAVDDLLFLAKSYRSISR